MSYATFGAPLPDLTAECPACHLIGTHPFTLRRFETRTIRGRGDELIELPDFADPPAGTPVIDRTCQFCRHVWTRSL